MRISFIFVFLIQENPIVRYPKHQKEKKIKLRNDNRKQQETSQNKRNPKKK